MLGQSDWICETRVGCSSRSMKVCPGHTNDRHGRGDPPDGSAGTLGPSTRPGARGGFIIHRSITVELSTAQTSTAKIAGMSDLQRKHLSRACSFVLVLGPLFFSFEGELSLVHRCGRNPVAKSDRQFQTRAGPLAATCRFSRTRP